MGFGKAIARALENGGRKTTVGGICASDYNLTKEDLKHIAKNGISETNSKGKKK